MCLGYLREVEVTYQEKPLIASQGFLHNPQKFCIFPGSRKRCLDSSDVVYLRGNNLRLASGVLTRQLVQAMTEITDLNDATTHNRHVDQIHFKSSTDQRHQEASEGDNQLHTQ
ncbi:unnamed protein product [Echinostoma caproni]|uniref:Uncharacterized protein n=1 Tax=Echinostoma caproni TaxID=27848 RepID=A0A183B4Z7_9TREM|nr:unnamed protein product [Echinostoma caproni]